MSILNPPAPVHRRKSFVAFEASDPSGTTRDYDVRGWSSMIVSTQGGTNDLLRISASAFAESGQALRNDISNIYDQTNGLETDLIRLPNTQYRINVSGLREVRLRLETANGHPVTAVLSSEPAIPLAGSKIAYFSADIEGTGSITPFSSGWGGLPFEAAVLVIEAIEGFETVGRPEVKYHPDDDWRSIPVYRIDGSFYSPEGFRGPGVYLLDLRGAVHFRVTRDGGEGWRARMTMHDKMPFTLSPGTDTAVQRFRRIEVEDGNVSGDFFAIYALTDCTLNSNLLWQRRQGESLAERTTGIEDTDQIQAGQTIFGPFARIRVNAGTVLGYYR